MATRKLGRRSESMAAENIGKAYWRVEEERDLAIARDDYQKRTE